VYRGQPHPVHQPTPAAANEAQAAHWTRDRRVRVVRRQLNYRNWPTRPPIEKGIDVAIAPGMTTTVRAAGDVHWQQASLTVWVSESELAWYVVSPE
jgi:hypothetical protein